MTVKRAVEDPSTVAVKKSTPSVELDIELDRASGIPVARQLEDQLTWLIATGDLGAGHRLPSIRRLGTALGVHHHTVRQAYLELDRRGLITVRQGAAATVREFSGLRLARPRAATAMTAWGVLIPGHTPFYLPFLRGIERVAAVNRALTVVSVTENNPVKAKFQMQEMMAAGVRGLIAASLGNLVRDEFHTDGPGQPVPIVYCDQPLQEEESITFDDAGAGYALAAHLAGDGHRRITLMTPTLEYPNMAALHNGFLRAADEGLIEAVDILGCSGFDVASGEEAATGVLSGTERPRAMVASADELAIGVLAAARKLGVRIPDELALASYGAIDVTAYVEPPVTTVSLPTHEMGLLAARRLAARTQGAAAEGRTTLSGQLVVRASCGPQAGTTSSPSA
jgi:DNA-binding LacI/PurR family transcriptional regulator